MKILIIVLVLASFSHCIPTQDDFDKQMTWGTYKPQLIHAISQRRMDTYNPITLSMMYFKLGPLNLEKDLIYKVPERKADSIKYNVTHADGSDIQVQEVTDPLSNFKFTSSFVKVGEAEFVDDIRNAPTATSEIGVIYTFALEQNNPDVPDTRTFDVQEYNSGYLVTVKEGGTTSTFYYVLRIENVQTTVKVLKLKLPYKTNWDPRVSIFRAIIGDKDHISQTPNVVSFVFTIPARASFILQVQHLQDTNDYGFDASFIKTVAQQKLNLEAEFKKTYFPANADDDNFKCAFASYSQLMAGLQFSYGDLDCEQVSENCQQAKAMLTHTPSRYGFPRPFLWDEGFHNQLSCWMRPQICIQSLTDWINTMSTDGWIPREQPRGDELRSYIPGLKENKLESNPPTFFFNFELLMQNFPNDAELMSRISVLYPKLKLWYQSWFSTQAEYEQGVFTGFLKWWGPSEDYNLGSGMDDWPRSNKNQVSKWHVDCQAWGHFLSDKMLQLTKQFNPTDTEFIQVLTDRIALITTKLYSDMLDPTDNLFKDVLYESGDPTKKSIFSPHLGYPNLFPLALGMITDQAVLDAQIKFMSDPTSIWTEFGLRSLSAKDDFFGVDSNYWRGPIWINIHYLVLRGLKLHYSDQGTTDFYNKLKNAIVGTVCGNFEQHGYFFEHYNQHLDGQGGGNHPFNGWTATISLIISEKY